MEEVINSTGSERPDQTARFHKLNLIIAVLLRCQIIINVDCVKRKGILEYVRNSHTHMALHMRTISSGPLLSVDTS